MNDMQNSQAARKQYIDLWVDKIYNENYGIKYLFPEPINQFKQYASDMFLDTNLTYEEIADSFAKLVEERQKLYTSKIALDKREKAIRDVVSNIYNENYGIFDKSLEDMQQEYINLYLNNKEVDIDEIKNILTQYVIKVKQEKVKNIPVVESKEINSEKNVVNINLDTMLNDPNNNGVSIINIEENELQNKNTNNKRKQVGFISLFNIVLILLSIVTFILVAMILNLLLK